MPDSTDKSTSPVVKWLGILAVIFASAVLIYLSNVPTGEPPPREPGVVLFRYNQQSESTEQREQGFLDTMQNEFPEINILSSSQHLGSTRSSSVRRTRQLIDEFGDAITGIFCVNESGADGCLQTLKESKRSGDVVFVGFDITPAMVAAMRRGTMAGTVLQDPKQMGYEAVNAALAHLREESVERLVKTGYKLVTADNLDSDEVQPFLYPERFSGERFAPEEAEITIGVVTKGISHDFWQSVRAGVEQAAREAGTAIVRFDAPAIEDDVDEQIEIVRRMIAEKVDAICLAPINSVALGGVVLEAEGAGVPVVIFDSGLDEEKAPEAAAAAVCYVATDNYEAGAAAARQLAAALKKHSSSD